MEFSAGLARRGLGGGLLAAALLSACGCSDDTMLPPATGRLSSSSNTAAVTDDDLLFCVSETNRVRASIGAGAVSRSADVEAYATEAAKADGTGGTTHGYTSSAHGPGPRVSFAENESLRWRLSRYGSIRGLITAALAAFVNEGPGGSHYENLRGPWRHVGCGLYVDGDRVTLVQHFR